MKQLFKGYAAIFCSLFFVLCSMSCAARIDGSIAANGSAVLSVNFSLQRGMTSLISRLSAAGGNEGMVLDSASISRSLSAAPGVSSARLRNTSTNAIEGQVHISRISDFLSAAGRGFITFEQRVPETGGRCRVVIDRSTSPEIIKLLSSDICDYLNALMAPIVTGENISKEEYLELVSSFYNNQISGEIASSRINTYVEFPGTVRSVSGGTFSGRNALFDIPLLDLFVLETPLVYEVIWN
ncbi:MAG: hypothetical protein FWB86_01690 [Treponema sp.]|nr:hypothetical protein [Treponema sp.]MCL2250804.1 hypothetical protein [Treponema sp.]